MAGFQQISFAFAPEPAKATAPPHDQKLVRKTAKPSRMARAEQLSLPGAASQAAEREHLELSLYRRVLAALPNRGDLLLTVTENRSTMISIKRDRREQAGQGPLYRVRVHSIFLDADERLVRDLALYIAENDRDSSQRLGDFIDANTTRIQGAALDDEVPLETAGDVHDLLDVFDAINQRYFQGRISARITWGRRNGRSRARTSIKMGSYSVEERLIRIHPTLDRPFVPHFFVEWIVFHEMLHQVHHIPTVAGRRQFHTPEFLAEERTFDRYAEARRWERQHLGRLLSY